MTALGLVLLVMLGLLLVTSVTSVVRSIGDPVLNIADELTTPVSPAEVETRVASLMSTARADYRMLGPGTYSLSYRYYPWPTLVLAAVLLPIGLLVLLLGRSELTLSVAVSADGSGSRIRVAGRAHQKFALAIGNNLQRSLGGKVVPV